MKRHLLLFTTVLTLVLLGCSEGEETPVSTMEATDSSLSPSPSITNSVQSLANDDFVPTVSDATTEETPISSTTKSTAVATSEPTSAESTEPTSTIDSTEDHIDLSTPVGTVVGHLTAISDGQFKASCAYWWEDEQDDCIESWEDAGDVSIQISNVEATPIIQLGGLAWVEVSYIMLIEDQSRDMSEVVELERSDGDWLIWDISDKEEDSEYYRQSAIRQEFSNVRRAVDMMMRFPDTPITDLDTDPRIASYANDQSHPTNDMTDGGLITLNPAEFDNGGRVNPVSNYLDHEYTGLYYIVDITGKVRCFLDENGAEEIEWP